MMAMTDKKNGAGVTTGKAVRPYLKTTPNRSSMSRRRTKTSMLLGASSLERKNCVQL